MAFPCTLLTPERIAFEGEVESVLLPGHDGELGIFPGHADFLGQLGVGLARLRTHGAESVLALNGGYLRVEKGALTILAEGVLAPSEANRAVLEAEISVILSEKPKQLPEAEARDARLAWARARLRLLS